MKSAAKIITGLALTGLFGACSGNKPDTTTAYIPSPMLAGQWTLEDILQAYGAYVKGKLNYYFTKAKVSSLPREVAFIALKQEKKLELWARDSGLSGPKLRQGNRQVPEGIYRIAELNPNRHYGCC
ncbi:MAG: hypothetical protein WAW61_16095 [Methylococcaceae bacterium]